MMYLNIAGVPVKVAAWNEEIRKFFLPYSAEGLEAETEAESSSGTEIGSEAESSFGMKTGSEAESSSGMKTGSEAESSPIKISGTTSEELLRDLSNQMADRNVFLIHGSSLALDGRGYLFTAPSGTGKSTHSRLWKEVFGNRVIMINDDKPFLRMGMGTDERPGDLGFQIKEPGESKPQLKRPGELQPQLKRPGEAERTHGKVYVCGSPWNGKHGLGSNIKAPLSGIAVLKQAKENRIERLSPQDAFRFLYTQIYLPKESERAQKVLDFMALLLVQVPVWMLYCRPDHDAVRVAVEAMYGKLG